MIIVSKRGRYNPLWPIDDLPAIAHAREMYDEGVVEMATGYTATHAVLYIIKRRVPRTRPLYFFSNPPAHLAETWHWKQRYADPRPAAGAPGLETVERFKP